MTIPTMENGIDQTPPPATDPSAVADSVEADRKRHLAMEPAVAPVVPPAPQTIATWRGQVSADLAPPTAPEVERFARTANHRNLARSSFRRSGSGNRSEVELSGRAAHHRDLARGSFRRPSPNDRSQVQCADRTSDHRNLASRGFGRSGAGGTPADRPAQRIEFVPPVHPRAARWLGQTGHVTLAIEVKADGTVASKPRVVAVHPAGRGFAESAIDAVQKWRFNPAMQRGRPIASYITVDVEFE